MDPEPVATVVETTGGPVVEPITGYLSAMSFVALFLVAVGILLFGQLRKRGRAGVD